MFSVFGFFLWHPAGESERIGNRNVCSFLSSRKEGRKNASLPPTLSPTPWRAATQALVFNEQLQMTALITASGH